jgi:hypothetical protein
LHETSTTATYKHTHKVAVAGRVDKQLEAGSKQQTNKQTSKQNKQQNKQQVNKSRPIAQFPPLHQ